MDKLRILIFSVLIGLCSVLSFGFVPGSFEIRDSGLWRVHLYSFNSAGDFVQEFEDVFIFENGTFDTYLNRKFSPNWFTSRTFESNEVRLNPNTDPGFTTHYEWKAVLKNSRCVPECIDQFKGVRVSGALSGAFSSSLGGNMLFFGTPLSSNQPLPTGNPEIYRGK